jgi:hypothetical protein
MSAATKSVVADVQSAPFNSFWLRSAWSFYVLLSTACWMPLLVIGQSATNSGSEEIPPLLPPRAEIPPSFWEQHRGGVIAGGILLLIAIGIALWFMLRVRPRAAVPPAVQAREALNPLLGQPENGILLSRVSQTLRRYIMTAFGLVPGELTTTEFCEVISANPSVGSQLSSEIGGFLRCCDERKFALVTDSSSLNAVSTALRFVDQSEQRCAELRQAEQKNTDQARTVSKDGRATG